MIRLVLALVVLLSHCAFLDEQSNWTSIHATQFGSIAVFGFFGISGFLIAGSAERSRPTRFLWQRFLRVFPGYWVCLVVTAGFFGLVGWLTVRKGCTGLSCYLRAPDSPAGYLSHNWTLRIGQQSIAGTPVGSRLPLVWNGSIWTLLYEFTCYLVLLGLAVTGLLRRRAAMLVGVIALMTVITVITLDPGLRTQFGLVTNWFPMNLMKFAAVFFTGALLYLYREAVSDSGWLAFGVAAAYVASLWLPNDGLGPDLAFTPSGLGGPLVVLPVLWLGVHLPFHRIGATNDYSYGTYVYAFPVQQLLLMWGVGRFGFVVYLVLTVAMTAPFAAASWWLVERPALRLRRVGRTGSGLPPPGPGTGEIAHLIG